MRKAIAVFLATTMLTTTVLPAAAASEDRLDRSEFIQMLYQRERSPALGAGTPSAPADVALSAEYSNAIRWASANGMLSGYGQNRVGPDDLLTREQLAVILYAYGGYLGLELPEGDVAFQDGEQVSAWALPAAQWAVANGLITLENGNLNPQGTVSVSQAENALAALGVQNANSDLDAMLTDADAPVSGYGVMAYRDGKLIYERTGGFRYIDAENPENNLPFETDTRYRTASISKTFAAIGAMRLVEQGKLDLDRDISDYLGFQLRNPNYPDKPITARMLMSHTSSLEDGSIYSIPPEYSIQEFFMPEGKYWLDGEHFANSHDGVDRSPGVYFHYCNLNYGVLGTVMECITGQRFDEYMKENVLEPMGIKASYNPGDFDANEIQKLSAIYQKQSGGVWDKDGPYIAQVDDYRGQVQDHDKVLITNPDLQDEITLEDLSGYQIGTNGTIFSPQGGLRISMDEMKTLIEMFLNDGTVNGVQILTPESVDAMFTPEWTYDEAANNGNTYSGLMCAYGLGIQTMTSEYGDRFTADRNIVLAGHFGEAYGLLAGLFMDRDTGDVIYYVMNGMGGPESENGGTYSSMYRWEEKFCTALLDNLFPEL